ncbi:SRPBCC domain-containing protein [Streptomyces anulatus]
MTDRSVTHATFTFERLYPATAARVFAAWADPKAKSRWFSTPDADHELDFRVGGREANRSRPDRPIVDVRFAVPRHRPERTHKIAAFTGVAERHSGLAAGLADTCFAVGTALGVAIAGSVVAAHAPTPGTAAPQTLVPGHQAAFGVVGLVAALGVVIALAMPGKPSAPVAEETAAPPVDEIVAVRIPPDPLRSFHVRP